MASCSYFIEEGFAEVGIHFADPEEVLSRGAGLSAGGASTEVRLDVLSRFLSILCPDGSSEDRLEDSSELEIGYEVGLDGRGFGRRVKVRKGGLEVEVGGNSYQVLAVVGSSLGVVGGTFLEVEEELVADGGAKGEVEVGFVGGSEGDNNASGMEESESFDVIVAVVGKGYVEGLGTVGNAAGWPDSLVEGGFEAGKAVDEVVVSLFVT